MATLFYDSFQNTNNWVGGNGFYTSINPVSDPKNVYQKAVRFLSTHDKPDTFSSVISSSYKSFTISFDYLGSGASSSTNLGCMVSIADGSSTTGVTIAYAGAIVNSEPPMYTDYICDVNIHNPRYFGNHYNKNTYFTFFVDDGNWHHYSLSFTTVNANFRVALSDYSYANYPEASVAGDCYFANLLVTDSYGPSPFIATSNPDNFRSISVDALNQIADTVSYVNSNAAVTVNLGSGYTSGGYAAGDNLNDIKSIIGSAYNDVILGNSGNNKLDGGNGNDNLTAGQGNDILVGGSGADTFIIATDVTAATISDLEINIDKIDLRLFDGLYTVDIVKASSTYTNGNTVISLGGGKTLTLQNINKVDLTSATFMLPEQPSVQPTTFPPSIAPSYSTPPTLSPTLKPSLRPTISISPSLNPSISPTLYPSVDPTKAPTPIPTSNKFILTGDVYEFVGTSIYEEITINSPNNLRITLNGGGDKIIFFTNAFAATTITDFAPEAGSIIDISVFTEVNSFVQLRKLMTFSGGTVITFENEQKIILENLPLSRLDENDFLFSTEISENDDNSNDGAASSTIITGSGIAAAVVGTGAVGSLAYCYYRKGNTNSNIVQNNFHLSDKKISPEYTEIRTVFDIKYDNPILNTAGFLENAYKLKGLEGMNAIIETGSDKTTYNEFKQEEKKFGFEKALSTSVEKYNLKNHNNLMANNFHELSKTSEYLPSITYVLKEIIYPNIKNFFPEALELVIDNVYDNSIATSIALSFIFNNLASFYSGSTYLENNLNSAFYAAGYVLPGMISKYIPEWMGGKCTSAIIVNSGLLAGKSYFSEELPTYHEILNLVGAAALQCKTKGINLPDEAAFIANSVDIGIMTGLLSSSELKGETLLENISEIVSMAPGIMLTDIGVKTFLDYLYGDNNQQSLEYYSFFNELF